MNTFSPLFLKFRTVVFSFLSFIWIISLSLVVFLLWEGSGKTERSFFILFLIINVLTIIMLPILYVPHYPAEFAAELILWCKVYLSPRSAATFAFWSPSIECPTKTPDQQGVCQLLNLYILVASWLIPILSVGYVAILSYAVIRRRRTLQQDFDAESNPHQDEKNPRDTIRSFHVPPLALPSPTLFITGTTFSPPAVGHHRGTTMSLDTWDAASVKSFLRLTSQKLGQLQERNDAQGKIMRRDIATLLQQDKVDLARAKAQSLLQQDSASDTLEVLEMHTGMLLEHFNQLEPNSSSPIISEAASTIIYAAPHAGSKELSTLREMLIHRLGPDFARSASGNLDGLVSPRVIATLSAPPSSAEKLDAYLANVAKAYGVDWEPVLCRQDIVGPVSEILDPQLTPVVDLPRLRKLCLHGIPSEPVWLRPRLWKLFLGFLPVVKSSWASEHQKYRESYYDLVRRLLPPIAQLPPPSEPLVPADSLLLAVHKHIRNVSYGLFVGLELEPEAYEQSPFNPHAPDGIKLDCATALDARLLELLKIHKPLASTPSIQVDTVGDDTPHGQDSQVKGPPPQAVENNGAHPCHLSALTRLLYLHCTINPGTRSPYVSSLLVPFYSVMCQEVDPSDVLHTEADTFWLFETMLSEFSELEDEETAQVWTKKLSQRLLWADSDLWDCLAAKHDKGLDPALPHYSYRWLAPLLTHTLPFSECILVWDALFTCLMRDKQGTPKIEFLLDICVSMLIRIRDSLFRLGKRGNRNPGLWNDETANILLPPPKAWGVEDSFMEGVTLLQNYPVESIGGAERILQTAVELSKRRIEEEKAQKPGLTLTERLKVTMWKGFTNQVASPYGSPNRSPSPEELEHSSTDEDSSDDGNATEKPDDVEQGPGFTSRLANTVWRGITNQSSMDAPPSPLPPPSPSIQTSPPKPPTHEEHEAQDKNNADAASSSFWRYAERLKDSDTVATISKASSNWRARSILSSWGSRSTPNSPMLSGTLVSSPDVDRTHVASATRQPTFDDQVRRGSLPPAPSIYSPPPRPAFFRQPRDSMLPHSRKEPLLSLPSSPENTDSERGFTSKAHSLQASLLALTGGHSNGHSSDHAPRKSGPRPLLLATSTVVTSSPRISRSATNTPGPEHPRDLRHLHRDSQSSISSFSLSPNDSLNKPRRFDGNGWDSDTLSRVIPLNRKSISPLAPGSRLTINRGAPSETPSASISDIGHHLVSPALATGAVTADIHGWAQVDSPSVTSPSAPKTPTCTHSVRPGLKENVSKKNPSQRPHGQHLGFVFNARHPKERSH
ncbi:hypothetical protein ONZ45_g563 [Pleurotus djamor]|nr:hypothetical protein ONZ45_g563 [Pleurotus djamor]